MSLNDYLLNEGENPFFMGSRIEKAKKFYFRYDPKHEIYFDSLLLLNISMNAKNEALPPRNNKYPTVLLMHDSPVNYVILSEYLTSHGYVVINFPVFGSEGIKFDNRTNAVESELRDIEFAIGYAKKLQFVDLDNLILAGFSYGGLSIYSYQMRHQLAKAIISFDTGITDSWGTGLMEKMPYFDVEKLTIPILHFWTTNGSWTQDLKWFKQYKYANRHSIKLDLLRHFDFTNAGLFRQFFPQWIDQVQGKALGDYVWGYQVICEETLSFLNAITNETTYETKIYPNESGKNLADEYFMALPLPPTFKNLQDEYLKNGIEGVKNVFIQYKSVDNVFSEPLFYRFSRWLERNANFISALDWIHLFIESYPNSTNAYYRLASIQEKLSNITEAQEAYGKVLELAPKDYNLDRHFRTSYIKIANEKLK